MTETITNRLLEATIFKFFKNEEISAFMVILENGTVRVYSLTGVCVYQNTAKSNKMEINIGNKGIYNINIQSADGNPYLAKISVW
jgi:hypothetical protein